jgi:N,N'-diacetyllegionaminate synthase
VNVFIIAEAGVNHNGSIEIAKKLVDVASISGANAIKFQTFKATNLALKNAPKAEYQKTKDNSSESQFDMLKKLELDIDSHKTLINHCNIKNIMFLSTPFDLESINLLAELDLKIIKIPSGEINNLPYLRHLGSLGKKVILSSGMSTLSEIDIAIKILVKAGTLKENITILHANTMYPTPMQDVNLRAMQTIQNKLGVNVGYSDHTLGIEVDIAAVAMGATVIEKHFTLDKTMIGPDHKSSLNPEELKSMISSIRNIELALGSNIKRPSNSEIVNINVVRKSLYASKPIKKGDKFTEKNIAVKRPGNGLSPMKWDEMIGQVAKKDYCKDDAL